MRVPYLGPVMGQAREGHMFGTVAESLFSAVYESAVYSSNKNVIGLDEVPNGFRVVDFTTDVTADTAIWPFGQGVIGASGSTFSADDSFAVACAVSDLITIHVEILTAASHSGSLRVWDSSDGEFADHLLTPSTDTSNAFRNLGWGKIVFGVNADRKAWAPKDWRGRLLTASRKWIRFGINGLVAGNTPPRFGRIFLQRIPADVLYRDITSQINETVTDGTFGTQSTFIPSIGQDTIYVVSNPAFGLTRHTHRAAQNGYTVVREFRKADGTWEALPDYTDPSNAGFNGPASLGGAVQRYAQRWTIPETWVSTTLSLSIVGGTTVEKTGFIFRDRISAVTNETPRTALLSRERVRQFGTVSSRSFASHAARQVRQIEISEPSSRGGGAMTAMITNYDTGHSRRFDVPTSPAWPHRVTFATPLSLAAGEQWDIVHVSGGWLRDTEMEIE